MIGSVMVDNSLVVSRHSLLSHLPSGYQVAGNAKILYEDGDQAETHCWIRSPNGFMHPGHIVKKNYWPGPHGL